MKSHHEALQDATAREKDLSERKIYLAEKVEEEKADVIKYEKMIAVRKSSILARQRELAGIDKQIETATRDKNHAAKQIAQIHLRREIKLLEGEKAEIAQSAGL